MQESPIHPNRIRLLAVIIVFAGLAAYSNCYQGLFVFDDEYTLEEFDPGEGLFNQSRNFFFRKGAPCCGRPPISFSLAVNHSIHGTELWGYHAMNVGIHLIGALLLFGLVRRTLLKANVQEEHALYLGMITAVLWAVHPINSSSVTYIGQRAESIMGMLFILTFYLAVRGKMIAAVVACWICVSAKEVGAMIPFVFVFYDRAFLSKSWGDVWAKHKWIYGAFILSWLVIPLLLLSDPKGNTVGFVYQIINPRTYLQTSCNAIIIYLKLMFYPSPLILDYGWPIAIEVKEFAAAMLGVVALFIATVCAIIFKPKWGFLGAAFFLILAPTTSVLPIISEIMAEHRMYLPSAVIIAYSVFAVYWLARRFSAIKFAWILAVIIAATFLSLTYKQNFLYHDKVNLWTYNSNQRPKNRRSWYNLGVALDRGNRPEDAVLAYQNSIICSPDWADPQLNMGSVLMDLQRFPEADKAFRNAIQFEPDNPDAYLMRGQLMFYMGNTNEGFKMFRAAQDVAPDLPRVYKGFAMGYLMVGNVDEAMNNVARHIGEPGINRRVIIEAIKLSQDLGRLDLAAHIQKVALKSGFGVIENPSTQPRK